MSGLLVHAFCESEPMMGLCGTDLVGVNAPDESLDCLVCTQLLTADGTCPHCGNKLSDHPEATK